MESAVEIISDMVIDVVSRPGGRTTRRRVSPEPHKGVQAGVDSHKKNGEKREELCRIGQLTTTNKNG